MWTHRQQQTARYLRVNKVKNEWSKCVNGFLFWWQLNNCLWKRNRRRDFLIDLVYFLQHIGYRINFFCTYIHTKETWWWVNLHVSQENDILYCLANNTFDTYWFFCPSNNKIDEKTFWQMVHEKRSSYTLLWNINKLK